MSAQTWGIRYKMIVFSFTGHIICGFGMLICFAGNTTYHRRPYCNILLELLHLNGFKFCCPQFYWIICSSRCKKKWFIINCRMLIDHNYWSHVHAVVTPMPVSPAEHDQWKTEHNTLLTGNANDSILKIIKLMFLFQKIIIYLFTTFK